MFSITYLEEKILTRTTFQLAVEKQADCKIIYSSGDTDEFIRFLATQQQPPDLCIISDCFHYTQLVTLIKQIKVNSRHSCILLKSDAKFIKGICFLLKNGLNGFFFTDEPLIDLKQSVRSRTKYNVTADWLKLITKNRLGEIEIRDLHYNTSPLTQKEISFIQACAKDKSYEEIAIELNKSLATIYGYRDRVFKKLQVKQRTAMVMTALKRNYIDL
jgi:DNA-binding NarL/FixJ family response regulator